MRAAVAAFWILLPPYRRGAHAAYTTFDCLTVIANTISIANGTLRDTSDPWFTLVQEKSTMTLAQTGIYVGKDEIREYSNFLSYADANPFLSSAILRDVDFYIKSVDSETGACVVMSHAVHELAMNETIAMGAHFNGAYMLKLVVELEGSYVSSADVYMAREFTDMFFGLTHSDRTFRYLCELMASDCPEVYSINGNPTLDECTATMASLPPALESGRLDGNTTGCRVIHGSFVPHSDKHCPHISFLPVEDSNGNVKCQKSLGIQVEDLFDADDIQRFQDYVDQNGDLVDSDTHFRILSMDDAAIKSFSSAASSVLVSTSFLLALALVLG